MVRKISGRTLTTVLGLFFALSTGVPSSSHAEVEFEFENSLDSLAASVLNSVQQISFDNGVEYCGTVYELDGVILSTPATKGKADSCDSDDDLDDAATILASYHTHGSYSQDADTEVPSVDDLKGDIEEKVKGYISTPGGRVWRIDGSEENAIMLCGPGCILSDPNFEECEALPPEEDYTLPKLMKRAEEDSGDC